jgi:hypothetical protein
MLADSGACAHARGSPMVASPPWGRASHPDCPRASDRTTTAHASVGPSLPPPRITAHAAQQWGGTGRRETTQGAYHSFRLSAPGFSHGAERRGACCLIIPYPTGCHEEMRTLEYRLYPNRAQRQQLMACLIASRAIYRAFYHEMRETLIISSPDEPLRPRRPGACQWRAHIHAPRRKRTRSPASNITGGGAALRDGNRGDGLLDELRSP